MQDNRDVLLVQQGPDGNLYTAGPQRSQNQKKNGNAAVGASRRDVEDILLSSETSESQQDAIEILNHRGEENNKKVSFIKQIHPNG